jgi:hypothetical protein
MKNKKGLQKFTKSKAEMLFDLDKITYSDLEQLTLDERKDAVRIMNEKINTLHGLEREAIIEKCFEVFDSATKNQLWENNHNQITWAISTLMQEYGRMPSKTEIATKTELSRQTVHKHIKEYHNHPQYLIQNEQFKFMTNKVLARVFYYAVNGDMAAAKLYLNTVGAGENIKGNTLIQNQNNYIQINGLVLNQETIKQLKPEQLLLIEGVLKTVIKENDFSK